MSGVTDKKLARLKDAYVSGRIEVTTYERCVGQVLAGTEDPLTSMFSRRPPGERITHKEFREVRARVLAESEARRSKQLSGRSVLGEGE